MPRFQMVFEGEEARLMQAFVKINRQYSEMKTQVRGAVNETKRGEQAFVSLGGEAVNQLASIGAGFLSLQQGISTLRQIWKDWESEIQRTNEEVIGFSERLIAITSGAGAPPEMVRPELVDIARRFGLTRQEVLQTFEATAGGALRFRPPEEQLGVVQQAAPFRALGVQPQQAAQIMGLLQQFGGMRGAEPQELRDVTLAAIQLAGQDVGRLTSEQGFRGLAIMQQFGVGGQEALRFMLSAFAGRQEFGGAIQQIAGAAVMGVEEPAPLPRGGFVSDETRRAYQTRVRYSQMSREEIFRNLMTDEEGQRVLLGKEATAKLQSIRAIGEEARPIIDEALSGDLFQRTLEGVAATPWFEDVERQRFAKSREDLARIQKDDASRKKVNFRTWVDEERTRLDAAVAEGRMSPMEAHWRMTGLSLGRFGAELAGEGPGMRMLAGIATFGGTEAARIVEEARQFEEGVPFEAAPGYLTGGRPVEVERQMERMGQGMKRINDQIERADAEGKTLDQPIRE